MEEYQKRVVEEKADLDKKIIALTTFNHSEKFAAVKEAERARMERQLYVMIEYSRVLGERIRFF